MTEVAELIDKFNIACSCRGVHVEAYAEAVSQTFPSVTDAFAHYLSSGSAAAPELFPFIDPDYYRKQLGAAPPFSVSPFEHYVTIGALQDLSPMPLFDPAYVRSQANDPHFENIFDYLANPSFASVDPHPLFSKKYYNSLHLDLINVGMDPFVHFMCYGWRERRSFHPFFRAAEYRRFEFPTACCLVEFNKYLASTLESPTLSLMQPLFDPANYQQSIESDEKIELPLQHFLISGWRRSGSAFPLFDQEFFLSQMPAVRNSLSPYVEYLSEFSHSFSPSKFFDPVFYMRSAVIDPSFKGSLLEHFVRVGAADGARPHRMAVVANAYPSRYSGFDAIQSFTDIAGHQIWLCSPADHDVLTSQLHDISDIEPCLSGDFLDQCSLHSYNGPIDQYGRSLIAITRKIARCNCLVISDLPLNDAVITRLCSRSLSLVSSARPWLTLFSCSSPAIAYWHMQDGCKAAMDLAMPTDPPSKALFAARALLASLPNRLIVKTDAFGVALLRACGSQILSAIPQVLLLVESVELIPEDRQWLREYVAVHYSEFFTLIVGGNCTDTLAIDGQLAMRGDMPRVISLLDEVS